MLIADAVHIWREPSGEYHVAWQASHPGTQVTVEALSGQRKVSAHYQYDRFMARISGLSPASRHTFRLRDQHGTEVLACERRLGMQGTPNFRDFGGYPAANGHRVKWGCLFRSGQLSQLSDQDVDLFASLGIALVCDFRRLEEQQGDPSRLPAEGPPRVASLPITPGSNARFFEEADAGARMQGPAAMFDFMLEINRDFVEDQTDTYARMFREILDVEDARVLVHCAAGKDRTGFAAAIILLALGVSRDWVMRDYMLTRQFFQPHREIERLKRKYAMYDVPTEAVLPMLEVHEDYLERALGLIERKYASVDAYLSSALAVGPAERAELQARYLQAG